MPAMIEVRETDPRFTISISTFVGRSVGPPRPPVRPPARPAAAFPLGGDSPPALLVHDDKIALATKVSANALYLMNLRDKLPPNCQVLLMTPL
jgi:hypothetical protein